MRQAAHASPDWKLIEPHLPDPATATEAELEMEGDLLRVRRFPEDALDYYNYALQRGGNAAILFDKLGVTQLELGNAPIARAYFERVVKLRRSDPQGWNNLGAVEFLNRNFGGAIWNYKRAIKLNRKFAVSHSNLGMAYVEVKDYSSANKEFVTALKLDPRIFQHDGTGGISLHMLSTEDHARFCFQMAKVYARMGDEDAMLHELETASQAGLDVQDEMSRDRDLSRYAKDPRVVNLVLVAKSMRMHHDVAANLASALPPAAPPLAPGR